MAIDDIEKLKPVEEFTKEDFLTGLEPYQYCCAFIDDPFEFERAKARVTERAAELKIRSFMTLLGNYCRKYEKNRKSVTKVTTCNPRQVTLFASRPVEVHMARRGRFCLWPSPLFRTEYAQFVAVLWRLYPPVSCRKVPSRSL